MKNDSGNNICFIELCEELNDIFSVKLLEKALRLPEAHELLKAKKSYG
jgi:hypothetical protein